ncbi:hypothetical protein SFUMM280S_01386 [Streptomyces fumanus]
MLGSVPHRWEAGRRARPAGSRQPVETQPYVRALLRQADVPQVRRAAPPARLDPAYPLRRDPREPLALATRRALGFATALLPGAELVEDGFRGLLREWARAGRLGRVGGNWASVDHQLDAHFGVPALDLSQLLSGHAQTPARFAPAPRVRAQGGLRHRGRPDPAAPPGPRHAGAGDGDAHRVGRRLAGRGDAWQRFWLGHQPWSWRESDAVQGEVRFLVPDHLTAPVESPSPTPVHERPTGRNARWVPSLAVLDAPDETLLANLHPWDVPAAAVVRDHAGIAALRSSRAPAPDSALARLGEASRLLTPEGMRYGFETSAHHMRPRIADLLKGTYEVAVGDRRVTVGLRITAARPVEGAGRVAYKGRRYTQNDNGVEHVVRSSRGFHQGGGTDGGGGTAEYALLGRTPYEAGWSEDGKQTSALSETDEHNQEGVRDFRFYRFDATAVLHGVGGPARALEIDTDGLVAMLPLRDEKLADGLEERYPHLFGTGTAAVAPDRPDARPTTSAPARGTPGGGYRGRRPSRRRACPFAVRPTGCRARPRCPPSARCPSRPPPAAAPRGSPPSPPSPRCPNRPLSRTGTATPRTPPRRTGRCP